jgi:imidazolonepropionase-like amidohydrolase
MWRVVIAFCAVASMSSSSRAAPTAIVDTTIEVGDGTVIEHGTVVFEGTKVIAVGAGIAAPAGAVVVDGRGTVTSPGFVAVDSQVGLFDVGMEQGLLDSETTGTIRAAFRAADGYNPLSVHVDVDREEGVTSAVLAPSGRALIVGQGSIVELRTALDAVPVDTAAMFGCWDGFIATQFGGGRGAMALAMRELLEDTRLYKKQQAAFERGELRDLGVERAQVQAMLPVVDGTLPLVVRADRATDILAVLALAKQNQLRVMIEGGAEAWLVVDALKAAQVPVIVVPSTSGSLTFDALHARDDLATQLHAAGVEVIVTSWATDNGTTRVREEAGIAVQNGLPRAVAIASIASTPARLFGVAHDGQRAGVLAVGARANVVMWSGDPLEVLSVAQRIWVAGSEVTTPSRQRQLAEKYKALLPQ